ncbi:hypothetical protein P692DRAFT_201810210 [Suillus brevipes Sb2]|nr:hypothetical protein P692DRAFT_201810210 [Suillus brevipes Sb2]
MDDPEGLGFSLCAAPFTWTRKLTEIDYPKVELEGHVIFEGNLHIKHGASLFHHFVPKSLGVWNINRKTKPKVNEKNSDSKSDNFDDESHNSTEVVDMDTEAWDSQHSGIMSRTCRPNFPSKYQTSNNAGLQSLLTHQYQTLTMPKSLICITRVRFLRKHGQTTDAIATLSLVDPILLGLDPTIHMCIPSCKGTHTDLAEGAIGWVTNNHGKNILNFGCSMEEPGHSCLFSQILCRGSISIVAYAMEKILDTKTINESVSPQLTVQATKVHRSE